jgi:hypothetical protein
MICQQYVTLKKHYSTLKVPRVHHKVLGPYDMVICIGLTIVHKCKVVYQR